MLNFLPSNNLDDPPVLQPRIADRVEESLNTFIPDNPKKPYDMVQLITKVVDEGYFLEVHKATRRTSWSASHA